MNARVIIIPILIAICLIGCRPQATPTEPYQEGGSEIAKGHYPRISPDGKAITYTRDNTIYVADTNGLNEKMIFRVRLYSQLLQWSSDGSRIGFIEADTVHWLNNRIVSIDIQTKERKILTPSIGVVRYIWSWNRSNSNIACWIYDYANQQDYLSILSNDGNGTILKKYPASEYSWSPDGLRIAYLSIRNNYNDTMYLYISSINADTVQTFLSYDGVLSSLQWSPDPNILAVNQTHQGLILYDVSTKTGLDTFSVWAGSTFDYPSYELSPDGRKIIYTHRWYDANPDAIIPTELYCIDIRSSQTKLVASAYPGIESYSWHPSSKEVFYGFNGKIYKVRVE